MKALSIFTFTILITIIAFTSCKKDQIPNTKNQIPANDLKLANMITGFKTRGESHLKSGTLMSIDTALWYIGATANFTYGDASHATEKTWIDSVFITLPITNGKIAEGEVYDKYQEVISNLSAIYHAKNEENKQLLAASVTTHSVSATEIVCKVTGIFAYGLPTNIPCSFNNVDSYCFWYLWQNHAICAGPNTSSPAMTDAAEETQKRIMNCRAIPYGNYWYDPVIVKNITDPSLNPIVPNSPKSNYRYAHMYWNSSQYTNPGINGCIPPADLNFYLSKTRYLIENDTNNGGVRWPGYSFINIDMWGESHLEQNQIIYQHQASISYGVLHWSGSYPESL